MNISSLIVTMLIAAQGQPPQQLPRDLAASQLEVSPASAQAQQQQAPAAPGAPQIPAIQLEQQNVGVAGSPFTITLVDGDLRSSLTALAQANGLNLSMPNDINTRVTIHLENVQLPEALDAILTPLGLLYQIDGRLLRVSRPQMETRTFTFDYVNTARSLSRSLSASASAGFSGGIGGVGGGSAGGGSATSISGTESTNLMEDVEIALAQLKSPGGRVLMNRTTGLIFATDLPENLNAIAFFLETFQNVSNRQVMIEARIIEVQLNEQSQAGVNWNVVLGNTLTLTSTMAQPSAFQIGVTHDDFSALLSVLKTQGNVNVISSPMISTMNNQPAVIRNGTQDVFFTTTTQTDGTGNIIQTVTTPATVQEGVVLDVTPHISDDGIITMNIHPTLTERTGQATSPRGDSVPIVDVRETDVVVRVAEGDTIVIGGLISDRTLQNQTKVPILGDLPVLGNLFKRTTEENRRTDLVILLTPRIMTIRSALDFTRERLEGQERLRQDIERLK